MRIKDWVAAKCPHRPLSSLEEHDCMGGGSRRRSSVRLDEIAIDLGVVVLKNGGLNSLCLFHLSIGSSQVCLTAQLCRLQSSVGSKLTKGPLLARLSSVQSPPYHFHANKKLPTNDYRRIRATKYKSYDLRINKLPVVTSQTTAQPPSTSDIHSFSNESLVGSIPSARPRQRKG